jgi:hypothetical protein
MINFYSPSDLLMWCGLLSGVVLSDFCLYQVHVHVIDVASGVAQFIHFDVRMFAFCRKVLFNNDPSHEFHYNCVYCQMFGRVVKFCKVLQRISNKSCIFHSLS